MASVKKEGVILTPCLSMLRLRREKCKKQKVQVITILTKTDAVSPRQL